MSVTRTKLSVTRAFQSVTRSKLLGKWTWNSCHTTFPLRPASKTIWQIVLAFLSHELGGLSREVGLVADWVGGRIYSLKSYIDFTAVFARIGLPDCLCGILISYHIQISTAGLSVAFENKRVGVLPLRSHSPSQAEIQECALLFLLFEPLASLIILPFASPKR